MASRETENNAYAKFWVTNKEHYGMLWYFKSIGLDWQNNNFARTSRFLVHFFAVTARLRRENA